MTHCTQHPDQMPSGYESSHSDDGDVLLLKSIVAMRGCAIDILVDLANIPREYLDGKHHACPGCGGRDRFRLIDESAGAVYCNQCFSEKNGDFLAAVQHFGNHSFSETVALCRQCLGLDEQPRRTRTSWHVPTLSHQDAELAAPERLDRAYRALLDKLELSADHVTALRNRGLTDVHVSKLQGLGVRSLVGNMPPIVSELIGEIGEDSLIGVPGFVVKTATNGNNYWTLCAAPGIVFPIFDSDSHIVALQVRKDVVDDRGKYSFVSGGKKYGGPSTGTPVQHCFGADRKQAFVTEGGLKALIAHVVGGQTVLGMVGVNSHSRNLVLGSIRAMDVDKAIIALDADWTTNAAVNEAVCDLRNAIDNATHAGAGLATWDAANKGLDDVLIAGQKIVVTLNPSMIDMAIDAAKQMLKSATSIDGVVPLPAVARSWLEDGDTPPKLFPVGIDWECGPETLITVGGAPGNGKSTLVLQAVTDAALADRGLRVIVANVEMTAKHQFVRQLALVSGEPYQDVRTRQADKGRIAEAYEKLRDGIGGRFLFLEWPFDLIKVARVSAEHEADLVVLDYVQRIYCDTEKPEREQRLELDRVMAAARAICMAGRCVIAVSSLNRDTGSGRGNKGNSVAQHRFRGSAELEFACNEGWILTRDDDRVTLHSVKQRDRENFDMQFVQDASLRFSELDTSHRPF